MAGYSLIDLSGQRAPFPVDRPEVKIGKDERSALLLADDSVSRSHASLERLRNGEFLLVDSGSRNGTYVNGIAIQQRKLRLGDEIRFGNCVFRFEEASSAANDGASTEELKAAYQSSIVEASKAKVAGETKVLTASKASGSTGLRSANAWHFFRCFLEAGDSLGEDSGAAVVSSILDDLAGIEGISCVSFFDEVSDSPHFPFQHAGVSPGGASELVAEKMREVAESGAIIEKRSGVFQPIRPDAIGDIDALVLPIRKGTALYAQGDGSTGIGGEALAVLQGAAEAMREGLLMRQRSETSIRAASRHQPSVEHGIVGKSQEIARAIEHARKAARFDAPVLITGPSGTGKELFANLIHDESSRSEKHDLCVIACNELFEQLGSELFGHERGAFTDAKESKPGAFERANGGTIFLDEIGELSLDLQARLLRVLESKSVQRLGGDKRIETDFRLLAATNRNLQEEVEEGRFREDLYYRISTVQIELPPLQDRIDDLDDLARHFLEEFSYRERLVGVTLESSALEVLKSSTWPGNVRQLRNVIENAIIFRNDPTAVRGEDIVLLPERKGSTPEPDASFEQIKDWHFRRALRFFEGNRKKTAEQLGIARSTFHEWIAKQDESER